MKCYAAGLNNRFQLTNNHNISESHNLKIPEQMLLPFDNIISIAGGSDHTIFVLNDGSVYALGDDTRFQIGIGQNAVYSQPTLVNFVNCESIVAAAAGWFYTLYVTSSGSAIYCRNECNLNQAIINIGTAKALYPIKGMKTPALIDKSGDFYLLTKNPLEIPKKYHLPEPVYDLAQCKNMTLALTVSGIIYGKGNIIKNNVYQNFEPILELNKFKVRRIFGYHECCGILKDEGHLLMYGDNFFGQLGTGNTENSDEFLPIKGFADQQFLAMDLGQSHTVLLSEKNGYVYTTGLNENGQLMLGESERSVCNATRVAYVKEHVNNIFCGDNFTIICTEAPPIPYLPMVHFGLIKKPVQKTNTVSDLYQFLGFS